MTHQCKHDHCCGNHECGCKNNSEYSVSNNNISKLYIASDHRGVGLKHYLREMLDQRGVSPIDLGTDNPNEMVDYSDIANILANAMLGDTNARGILICGTGAGMLIAANRYRHIRASRCDTPDQAHNDRYHDDINVIVFGADDIDPENALICTQEFLTSEFDAIERRIRRIEKMS